MSEVLGRWFGSSWGELGLVLTSTVLTFLAVILATRITGLRSFSKMSSFDFAMTVAIGSTLAATATSSSVSLASGVAVLIGLYGTQVAVALLRQRAPWGGLVDNTPRVLMVGGAFLDEALRATRVTQDDVRAKLREANVLRYENVLAVVLETTGDISVLHGDGPLETDLLCGVTGAERVAASRDGSDADQ